MISDFLPISWRWDVTQAPFNADPTGERDCTQALIAAMNAATALTMGAFGRALDEISALPFNDGYHPDGFENRKENGKVVGIFPAHLPYVPTIYLPEGIYQISDRILYDHANLTNSSKSELNAQIRLRGDGPGKTVIRLADHAKAFQGEVPRAVVSLMRGHRTNVAMSNYVEDLTIDVGAGNPAAVGLDFYANNTGCVRNVAITCPDGAASRGLMLGHCNYSGILLKHITINGFQTGLHIDSSTATMYMAGEDISVTHCQLGVFTGRPSASLRNIRVENCSAGVLTDGAGGLLVLIDSLLQGRGGKSIELRDGYIYAANVQVRGFEGDRDIDQIVLPGEAIADDIMPRLNVEETPEAPETIHRCLVNDFGALGDGQTDDAPAIQQALNSGADVVEFAPGKYLLDSPVVIPAGVNRVAFHFVDLVAGPNLRQLKDQGAFIVRGDSDTPLLFEDLFAWEQWSGEHYTIDHASKRTLVISDVHTQTLPLYRNGVSGGKVFLDNIACTAGVIPGTKGHDRVCMAFRGQQVWARQINPERGEPMVLNDGGDLWVLGYKTEDDATAFHTINGGRTEVLGGVLNCGGARHPSFLTEDAQLRVTTTSNGWQAHNTIHTAIMESCNGEQTTVAASQFPNRGLEPERGPQFVIPLYGSPVTKPSPSNKAPSATFSAENLH
ncbi:glycosyl hydrolase family 28-related protein [Cerasicoccus fimbriatus]|uniref:glycosyl hydrolase family 28-related protein n=1 Tax=Cerasicoccus fimbriatus TaxID=3014554 RepID=UPI0022B4D9CA|nr:glycosyl hydrolase family 28-related protein [Cerasicoccus sp. TK19100]